MIETIQPGAEVVVIFGGVESPEVATEFSDCDVAFGCFDNDLARLVLTKLSMQSELTYFDLATDTGEDEAGLWFGGRLAVSVRNNQCLLCMKLLDQREIARVRMNDQELEEQQRIYGVEKSALNGTGPSVISLNGVVGSIAVTEFMAWITGIRGPKAHLVYHGEDGGVRVNMDPPEPNCFYCHGLG